MNDWVSPADERLARRFDVFTIAGAGLVGALLLAALLVIVHDSGSGQADQDLPYLPFSGDIPVTGAVSDVGDPAPYAEPGAAPSSDTPQGAEFVTIVGSVQVNASAPSDAVTQPGCGQTWAPRLQVELPDGQSLGTAVLQSPGMTYGPIEGGGRVSWNCTYRYQVGVLLDQPTYVFHAYGGAGDSGVGTRRASAYELTGGQGPTVSLSVCSRCGYRADQNEY